MMGAAGRARSAVPRGAARGAGGDRASAPPGGRHARPGPHARGHGAAPRPNGTPLDRPRGDVGMPSVGHLHAVRSERWSCEGGGPRPRPSPVLPAGARRAGAGPLHAPEGPPWALPRRQAAARGPRARGRTVPGEGSGLGRARRDGRLGHAGGGPGRPRSIGARGAGLRRLTPRSAAEPFPLAATARATSGAGPGARPTAGRDAETDRTRRPACPPPRSGGFLDGLACSPPAAGVCSSSFGSVPSNVVAIAAISPSRVT